MIHKLKLGSIIFNSIAIIILFASLVVYNISQATKQDIEKTAINSQIQYVDNITNNIASLIVKETGKNTHKILKNNKNLRNNIEKNLELFVTDRYKYVYIVDREEHNENGFRFLLDGSKNQNDKAEFEEPYTPLNVAIWNNIYQTKKESYFKHQGNKNLWITYLKPIIVNENVSAIIAIDFSLQESKIIVSTLDELTTAFKVTLIFSIIIFFVIVGFSYTDNKREKAKTLLYNQLEEKTEKISQFNTTLKQKVEDELAKNREKDKYMLQQSRLAQMGEMIGMIAHQWRQPLAAISSTSSAVKLKATLGKLDQTKAIELSENISEYSQHLSNTIDDFREFFKPNKEKREVTFDELTQGVLSIVATVIQTQHIQIIQDLQCHDTFYSYPNELKQVILNLIKNAEDILLEKQIQNAWIKIKSYNEQNSIILEISDNGGGIPNDILDKIFDPYFSTKKEKDGTGIGLYMSKTIIESHCKGKLSASNDSVGAIFKIRFTL